MAGQSSRPSTSSSQLLFVLSSSQKFNTAHPCCPISPFPDLPPFPYLPPRPLQQQPELRPPPAPLLAHRLLRPLNGALLIRPFASLFTPLRCRLLLLPLPLNKTVLEFGNPLPTSRFQIRGAVVISNQVGVELGRVVALGALVPGEWTTENRQSGTQ